MINKPINVAASVLITYQFYQFTIKYNFTRKSKSQTTSTADILN